jgi:putative DNA primase/helicase
MVTGGDAIYCAFKGKTHFQYRPQFKLVLVSNRDVQAAVDDTAFWQRVIRIEFPHTFAGREDKSLKARLQSPEVLAGVLAWCVEGAKRFYTDGLNQSA